MSIGWSRDVDDILGTHKNCQSTGTIGILEPYTFSLRLNP